jgi:hypothetical protein
VDGASHAFSDWEPDEMTKSIFARHGVFFRDEMETFFNSVFYRNKKEKQPQISRERSHLASV